VDFEQGANGSQCQLAGTLIGQSCIGVDSNPDANKCDSVTSDAHAGMVMDGMEGARMYCAVTQQGSGFALDIEAQQGANYLKFSVASIPATATESSPTAGLVTLVTDRVGKGYTSTSANPCQFYFNDAQRAQLAPGRVWVSFKCPTLQDPSANPASLCAVNQGYAAFQNCEN